MKFTEKGYFHSITQKVNITIELFYNRVKLQSVAKYFVKNIKIKQNFARTEVSLF